MRNLIVITRMNVSPNSVSDGDEFVVDWGQDPSEPHNIPFSEDERTLLLIHGCYKEGGRKKYYDLENPEQAVGEIIDSVYDQLEDDLDSEELGFLFHPASEHREFIGIFEDKVSEEFGDSVAFKKKHWQGAIYKDTNINWLADVTVEDGGNWHDAFDAVWEEHAEDKELERKLNLLHYCLTPNGADAFYGIKGTSDHWSEETWETVGELADYPVDPPEDDWLDADSEYMTKLTDLRNRLLDAP